MWKAPSNTSLCVKPTESLVILCKPQILNRQVPTTELGVRDFAVNATVMRWSGELYFVVSYRLELTPANLERIRCISYPHSGDIIPSIEA